MYCDAPATMRPKPDEAGLNMGPTTVLVTVQQSGWHAPGRRGGGPARIVAGAKHSVVPDSVSPPLFGLDTRRPELSGRTRHLRAGG
jgi:hypothetical protein